ncbi:ferric-dicitrate binding protein FerR (iron transport regulator) [Chitinophaga dinghuensis]|uniref:Ferric-dicitrate binding protein FerR (Iron transport regulator) n=1 Tax=Chitinophaga dinghuensis TaxID=1539050 RepID=A0A327VW61_9BACT|nr:FecR domain-containing protein [Chitinophaga dinghuensis]RAJ80241.1 ferric-dicitrate binding protein FerR (iron transport regulator) [Chitinophaga dinghuensis]
MSISSDQPMDMELLGKYLSGEASPEEAMAIDEWLAADPENRRQFQEITALWENMTPGKGHQLPDKTEAVQEFKRLLTKKGIATVHPIRKVFPYKSIAAGLLLLVCATSAYFLLYKKPADTLISKVVKQTNADVLRDTLPDHSVVVLNSFSQLKYAPNFNEKKRELLLQGQAWFDVTADPQKPFVVQVGDIHIKVLGTSFNVIQDTNHIAVSVKTGAILMYRGADNITVKAGQKGVYNVGSQHFSLSDAVNINSMGYATRVFNFENATLKEVTTELSKAYNVKFIFGNQALENNTISSSFEDKPLEYILEVISITLNVECRKEQNIVYISEMGKK